MNLYRVKSVQNLHNSHIRKTFIVYKDIRLRL